MAQWLGALDGLPKVLSLIFSTFFELLWVPNMHMVHRHTCRQNTHIYINKLKIKNIILHFCITPPCSLVLRMYSELAVDQTSVFQLKCVHPVLSFQVSRQWPHGTLQSGPHQPVVVLMSDLPSVLLWRSPCACIVWPEQCPGFATCMFFSGAVSYLWAEDQPALFYVEIGQPCCHSQLELSGSLSPMSYS